MVRAKEQITVRLLLSKGKAAYILIQHAMKVEYRMAKKLFLMVKMNLSNYNETQVRCVKRM
jgi:hypothetical protein